MNQHNTSTLAFNKAQEIIPGGVNSPVRACKNVGSTPRFIKKALGATLTDIDDNQYIDYVGSWGPMILGHAHPAVINAVKQAIEYGLSFGAPTEGETELALLIQSFMPAIEQIRLVNSGTEATMSAIRLARAFTKRDKIIKFAGCYHGHSDCLLVQAGSGALTHGVPSSPGVPEAMVKDTLIADFNAIESVKAHFNDHSIAAVIIEPIAGNMNLVKGDETFLRQLSDLCQENGTLLILDEVKTGFRVAAGGAQRLYGITPDLTCLGKITGGGMPIGACGALRDIMQHLAPQGPVYQAGTLSGNPIATAAGIATLSAIQADPDFYHRLSEITKQLVNGIQSIAQQYQLPCHADYVGGMFGMYWGTEKTIDSYAKVMQTDTKAFSDFYHLMLAQGIYLAPSPFEAGFTSLAHTPDIIKQTLEAFEQSCKTLTQ